MPLVCDERPRVAQSASAGRLVRDRSVTPGRRVQMLLISTHLTYRDRVRREHRLKRPSKVSRHVAISALWVGCNRPNCKKVRKFGIKKDAEGCSGMSYLLGSTQALGAIQLFFSSRPGRDREQTHYVCESFIDSVFRSERGRRRVRLLPLRSRGTGRVDGLTNSVKRNFGFSGAGRCALHVGDGNTGSRRRNGLCTRFQSDFRGAAQRQHSRRHAWRVGESHTWPNGEWLGELRTEARPGHAACSASKHPVANARALHLRWRRGQPARRGLGKRADQRHRPVGDGHHDRARNSSSRHGGARRALSRRTPSRQKRSRRGRGRQPAA
jgi:hypothetical protein